MITINISLPEKLKDQARDLIKEGFYASFSDLVRDSLRKTLESAKYDMWVEEAKEDIENGGAVVLKNKKQIRDYFEKI